MKKNRVAVIGAGPMGLACAYELLKQGFSVTIFEKDDRIGGMSASFDFDGTNIERYYHYICGPDYPLFDLLKELDIFDTLKWTHTKMGFFYEGVLYKWGTPFDLLLFPKIDILSRLRYGLLLFFSSKRKNWKKLDMIDVIAWLKKNIGERAYQVFWDSLFQYKFYALKKNISAAWIWSRIKRMALSRKNIFTERLGYLEGGCDILLNALEKNIRAKGGKIHVNSPVEKVLLSNKSVTGVTVHGKEQPFDIVISTIPTPYIATMIPDLPPAVSTPIAAIQNIAVVCVILKLTESISPNFWMNINDAKLTIPGIIEFSNLVPMKEKIVYVPYYMPQTHEQYHKDDAYFLEDVTKALARMNPSFRSEWILSSRVFRLEYAQPVCPPSFSKKLPSMKTEIEGLFIADTAYCYPEDRSMSESIRIGQEIAHMIHL